MNGAQLVYLRDLSNVPPDTQMELRNFALQHMYPSMAAHIAASMMLGDMRDIITQFPYEELLMPDSTRRERHVLGRRHHRALSQPTFTHYPLNQQLRIQG